MAFRKSGSAPISRLSSRTIYGTIREPIRVDDLVTIIVQLSSGSLKTGEVGKYLNADLVVVTRAYQVGHFHVLGAEMIDVATGEIVSQASSAQEGAFNVLLDAARLVGQQLLGQKKLESVADVTPPAEEIIYSFSCKELYQQGRQSEPTWSKGWFGAGFWITFATTAIGLAVDLNSEEENSVPIGIIVGAGTGIGISILLPLMITSPPAYHRDGNAEADECYAKGYMRRARATNTGASFLGSILGGPAVPVGLVTMIIAELLGFRW